MNNQLKEEYLKTIFHFKKVINTEFGHNKKDVLSLTDLLIMQCIVDGKNSVTIANELGLTKAAVSQGTTSLEKKNLITRDIDPDNRRNLTLTLTKEGTHQLNATNDAFDMAFAEFVKDMGNNNLEQLLKLMRKMTSIIDE
ncbi:MarR family winged helix-turn-helix transcriptional regulator [Companilactobacillus nantensis]|uniref:HTH marR-type domain-containing protein n=1 Tax=Companilactobacillus nantensis DSM 16982 TaxID=1423774 RepID=A0A0R1WR44_9LACO|nr:MarR family transcriptional regulator [Companilactobacillus nantensis]KRM18660.1 hypothetical protein FD31_GL000142 [Companilactobacillus nantensis DSM 16982]GEO63151.1 hypothetical protein LNA01_03340 [Companilactobacillus nantensis]